MTVARPAAWVLAGLALLPSGVIESQQGKKKDRKAPQQLVELPADYVRFTRVPDGGTSPRIALGKEGALALLYYKGVPSRGDLYLARSTDDGGTFSPSVRLNEQEGTVRGDRAGSVDIGPDGSAHVTWITTEDPPRLRYVREKPGGGLEPAQDLGTPASPGVSTAVALGSSGEVYVFYAADGPAGDGEETAGSRIWMQKSSDGQTFAAPIPVDDPTTRVSLQSSIDAHVDSLMNTVFVLYRAGFSAEVDKRSMCDMRLLASESQGRSFKSTQVDVGDRFDPRSGASLTQETNTTLAAWEKDGQVYWAVIRRAKNKVGISTSPKPSDGPTWRTQAAAASSDQEVMVTWLEFPSKKSEELPTLGWQIWTKEPLAFMAQGRVPQIPRGTNPVVVPRSGRGFTVIY